MRGNELLDKMELVDPAYVEAADRNPVGKRSRWIKWGAVAACLSLVAIGGGFLYRQINANQPESRLVVETIENIEEIYYAYGGELLVQNFMLSDARSATVELSHDEEGGLYDTSGWGMLSVSADYPDYSMVLNCSFQKPEEGENLAEFVDRIPYGDILVSIYRKESEPGWNVEYIYEAVFEYDGVFYEVSTYSKSPDCMYDLLDMVMGACDRTENGELPAQQDQMNSERFTNVLGFDGCRIRVEEVTPHFYTWYYYAEADGKTQIIAESFGYEVAGAQPEGYSVDLDEDGVPELICNCVYGDGAERVLVYRNNNGVIEVGGLAERRLETDFNIDLMGGVGGIIERYDPVENVIHVINYATDGSVRTADVKGMEYLEFRPYVTTAH